MTKTMWKTATMVAAVMMFQGFALAADRPAQDRAAENPSAKPVAGRDQAQSTTPPRAGADRDRDAAARDRDAAGAAAARDAEPAAGRAGAAGRDAANANFDQKFVNFAANASMYEIALGNIAKERSQSDDVKQLAQMMIDDHTQASRQLKQAAQKAGIDVPTQMDQIHQAMLSHMQETRGQMFERAYVIDQTAGHVKAVLKFRDATQMAQNQDIKSFATTALPKLQQHYQHAAKLAGWQGAGEAQPAGARERGTGAAPGDRDRSGTGTGTGTGTDRGPRSGTGSDRGQTSGATSGGQGPTGPGGAGDTGSTPRNK